MGFSNSEALFSRFWDIDPCKGQKWEIDFYTPQVLGGAALFDNSAPAVYKIQGP